MAVSKNTVHIIGNKIIYSNNTVYNILRFFFAHTIISMLYHI